MKIGESYTAFINRVIEFLGLNSHLAAFLTTYIAFLNLMRYIFKAARFDIQGWCVIQLPEKRYIFLLLFIINAFLYNKYCIVIMNHIVYIKSRDFF